MPRRLRRPDARSIGLAGFSILAGVRGVGYLPGTSPDSLPYGVELLTRFWSSGLTAYALVWIAAGIIGVVAALGGRGWRIATFLWAWLLITWGSAYLTGWWVSGFTDRQWTTGLLHLAIGFFCLCSGVAGRGRPTVVVVSRAD